MVSGKKVDLVDTVFLVVVENFDVFVFQEVEVDLMAVVSDSHHKSTLDVEGLDFLVKW
jgi:hypothetical protein